MNVRVLLVAAITLVGAGGRVAAQTAMDRRTLVHDETFGRVVCKSGTEVGLDDKRRLFFCTIAGAVVLDGLPIAAGAYTLFHPNGRVFQTELATPRKFTLADGRTVSCEKTFVVMTDDGRLKQCVLAATVERAVTAAVGASASFHPDGRIAAATIIRPVRVRGTTFVAGTALRWDSAGRVVGGTLRFPMRIGGLLIQGEFDLHPDGKLATVKLGEPTRVQQHAFPKSAELSFRSDGTLERSNYIQEIGFLVHGEEWRDLAFVTYDRSGAETGKVVKHFQGKIPEPIPGR